MKFQGKFKVGDRLSFVGLPPMYIRNKKEEELFMKTTLKRAAAILGGSENLLTDVLEFYSEVVKTFVAKRRKDEKAKAELFNKIMKPKNMATVPIGKPWRVKNRKK